MSEVENIRKEEGTETKNARYQMKAQWRSIFMSVIPTNRSPILNVIEQSTRHIAEAGAQKSRIDKMVTKLWTKDLNNL